MPAARPVAKDRNLAISGQNTTRYGLGGCVLLVWDAFGSDLGDVKISDRDSNRRIPKAPLSPMCCRWGRPAKPMFGAFPKPHHVPKCSTMDSNPFSTTLMAPLNAMGCQRGHALGATTLQSRAWRKTGFPATTQARKNGRVPENGFRPIPPKYGQTVENG